MPNSIAEECDDVLMTRAAAGERAAFAAIVTRYQPILMRLCSFLLRTEASAAEATQDVFLQLWRSRERYRPEGKLRALLFAMARNRCHSIGRKRRLRALFLGEQASEPLPVELTADDDLKRAQLRKLLSVGLLRLDEKYRLCILLRFVEGLPYDDIARVIGRTPAAARSRVHNGLKMLAARLPMEILS